MYIKTLHNWNFECFHYWDSVYYITVKEHQSCPNYIGPTRISEFIWKIWAVGLATITAPRPGTAECALININSRPFESSFSIVVLHGSRLHFQQTFIKCCLNLPNISKENYKYLAYFWEPLPNFSFESRPNGYFCKTELILIKILTLTNDTKTINLTNGLEAKAYNVDQVH